MNVAKFWASIDTSGGMDACWPWMGWRTTRQGYGLFYIQRKGVRAHRISYELAHGVPPNPRLTIDHLCRNTACVNPAHLELVTSRENTLRGFGPTARHARQTECKRGHPLSGDNLRITVKGRQCRTCDRFLDRRRRERQRAARRTAA